jgi:Na+/H+ antiporter NhaD/arsenite permease-like protein
MGENYFFIQHGKQREDEFTLGFSLGFECSTSILYFGLFVNVEALQKIYKHVIEFCGLYRN